MNSKFLITALVLLAIVASIQSQSCLRFDESCHARMGTTPDDCCDGLYCGFKSAYDAVINKGYCDYKTKPCSRYHERCHVSMGTTPDNCCNGLTCQFANAQDAVLNHGYCAYPKNV